MDRRTGMPMARGPCVVEAARAVLGEQARPEFFGAQAEVCTRPTACPAGLRSEWAGPGPAAAGDLELARELFDGVRRSGGGAARQRASYLRRGRLSDVVGDLVRTTDRP